MWDALYFLWLKSFLSAKNSLHIRVFFQFFIKNVFRNCIQFALRCMSFKSAILSSNPTVFTIFYHFTCSLNLEIHLLKIFLFFQFFRIFQLFIYSVLVQGCHTPNSQFTTFHLFTPTRGIIRRKKFAIHSVADFQPVKNSEKTTLSGFSRAN